MSCDDVLRGLVDWPPYVVATCSLWLLATHLLCFILARSSAWASYVFYGLDPIGVVSISPLISTPIIYCTLFLRLWKVTILDTHTKQLGDYEDFMYTWTQLYWPSSLIEIALFSISFYLSLNWLLWSHKLTHMSSTCPIYKVEGA